MNEQIQQNIEQVVVTLQRCLEQFFQETMPQEQRIAVGVDCGDPGAYEMNEGITVPLCFRRPDEERIEGYLTVNSTGGNVYSVTAEVAGRGPETMNVNVPDVDMTPDDMQAHVRELCEHLLGELELETGEQFLRDATAESEQS